MSLESGLYVITSKLTSTSVGRYPIEDLSLGPKPVVALPDINIAAPLVRHIFSRTTHREVSTARAHADIHRYIPRRCGVIDPGREDQ